MVIFLKGKMDMNDYEEIIVDLQNRLVNRLIEILIKTKLKNWGLLYNSLLRQCGK